MRAEVFDQLLQALQALRGQGQLRSRQWVQPRHHRVVLEVTDRMQGPLRALVALQVARNGQVTLYFGRHTQEFGPDAVAAAAQAAALCRNHRPLVHSRMQSATYKPAFKSS